MTASETDIGSLLVSWSLANSKEVARNFTLTATNLNDTNVNTITVLGIMGQSHTLNREDIPPCAIYSFQVVAWNELGQSSPSDNITSGFFTLTNLLAVVLQHSLRELSGDRVELNVTYTPSMEVLAHSVYCMYLCTIIISIIVHRLSNQ